MADIKYNNKYATGTFNDKFGLVSYRLCHVYISQGQAQDVDIVESQGSSP